MRHTVTHFTPYPKACFVPAMWKMVESILVKETVEVREKNCIYAVWGDKGKCLKLSADAFVIIFLLSQIGPLILTDLTDPKGGGATNGPATLIGVISWGYGCGTPGYPGVYSRVPMVVKWIEKMMYNPDGVLPVC